MEGNHFTASSTNFGDFKMQDLLTAAIEFTALGSVAMFAVAFASGYCHWKARRSMVPDVQIDMEPIMARLDEIAEECFAARAVESAKPIATDTVVPFSRKAPTVKGLPIRRLKAIAKAVKLPKYSNDTAAVLEERLSALPAWKLQEAVSA